MPLDDTTGFLKAPAKAKLAKPDVFSVTGLRDWLRTQSPTEEYHFMDCRGKCLAGQYLAARGVPWFGDFPNGENNAWGYLTRTKPAMALICFEGDHTFSAALARCEAWLAEHPEEQ